MSEWQILGIAPTRDESEIRRAYVRLLKQHRPDRDAEGYQRLREAWEKAKRYAASGSDDADGAASLLQGDAAPAYDDAADGSDSATAEDGGQDVSADSPAADRSGERFTPPPVYGMWEIDSLAALLLSAEPAGMAQVMARWTRVMASGSLQQQQQFHQHLALALVGQPALTETLLLQISAQLGWDIDAYDNGSLLPDEVVWQLQRTVRNNEVEQAWRALLASAGDSWRSRRQVALITGHDEKMPLRARLIPNLLSDTFRQVAGLCDRYPELAGRINPIVRQSSQQPCCALSWAGLYLMLFWSLVLNRSAVAAHPAWPVLTCTGVLMLFYLYGADLIFLRLRLRRSSTALTLWCLVECLLSTLVIALVLLLMHLGLQKLPGSPTPLAGLVEVVLVLILLGGLWRIRERGGPVFRWPGQLVSWLLAVPWNAPRAIPARILATLVGFILYFASCAVLYEYFQLLNGLVK